MEKRRSIKGIAWLLLMAVTLSFAWVPESAQAAKVVYPKSVQLSAKQYTMNLTTNKKMTLVPIISPAKANKTVTWRSTDPKVAKVSSKGVVTALKAGTTKIAVQTKYGGKVFKATVTVLDSKKPKPTAISVSQSQLSLNVGSSETLKATVQPASAESDVVWTSDNKKVATVSSNGKVKGVKAGSAVITVASKQNSGLKKAVKVTVGKFKAPTTLSLIPNQREKSKMEMGESFQLRVSVSPSGSNASVAYETTNSKILKVTESGLVTAVGKGKAKVRARSTLNSKVSASIQIEVSEKKIKPVSVGLSTSKATLTEGESLKITAVVNPAGVSQAVTWKSSSSAIATVSTSGTVKAVKKGTATITATSVEGKLTASATITVESKDKIDNNVVTALPYRFTPVSEISGNMKKIDAILKSSKQQALNLRIGGEISAAEEKQRQMVVERAFDMKAFPWMVESDVAYWNGDPARTFKPGNVYYGLPYIQYSKGKSGLDHNVRRYNVDKALAEKRYVKTGSYYTLNHSRMINDSYVGNDCSSFVSQAMWGPSHAASYWNTASMITNNTYYKTLTSTKSMRPGDLLVKRDSGAGHTVLFLYYTDAAKTKMMIIEQGGGGNTIIMGIKDISTYIGQGYKIRRRIDFR